MLSPFLRRFCASLSPNSQQQGDPQVELEAKNEDNITERNASTKVEENDDEETETEIQDKLKEPPAVSARSTTCSENAIIKPFKKSYSVEATSTTGDSMVISGRHVNSRPPRHKVPGITRAQTVTSAVTFKNPKQPQETLSKDETRKRMMSWRKTTRLRSDHSR